MSYSDNDVMFTDILRSPIPIQLLSGGTSVNKGRVQVLHNGTWGTLCSHTGYDIFNGNVICKQLGYSRVLLVSDSNMNYKY